MNNYNYLRNQKILCVFLVTFVTGLIKAQQQPGPYNQYNQAENNYPQTPQASAFEKFISIPPGNYTGVHGFSVPIYNMQVDEYTLPISIDYHGGGIKVDEISGEVGLGWNLNIGGINLSQEVRGMNDIFSRKINIENPYNFVSNIWPNDEYYDEAYAILNGSGYNWFPDPSGNLDRGFEYNPDYYSYSLLNNQGKFIFDKVGAPHTIPKNPIQILNEGTLLIDQKGVRYEFIRYQHTENQMPASNGIIPRNRSHAYRIDKVIFPNGDNVKFNYIPESYTYISNFSTSKRIYESGNNLSCIFPFEDDQHSTVRTYAEIHLIESIEYKNTVIKFKYLSNANIIVDREDINGGARLEKIEVYFKPTQGQLQLRKEYKLNTSYFVSPTSSTNVPSSSDFPISNLFKRLRLDSIQELLSNQTYSFEYDNTYSLPARFSYATDHWGVFNGAPNEKPLPYYVYTDSYSQRKRLIGDNKYPSLEYAKTGVLKKVYLPTGGSQEFEYELDEYRIHEDPEFCYSSTGQLCPDEEDIRFERKEYNLERLEFWYNQLSYGLVAEIPLNPNYPQDFRDGFDYVLSFWTNYRSSCDYSDDQNPGLPDEDYFRLEIYENGNNNPIRRIECNNGDIEINQLVIGKNYHLKIFKMGMGGWNPQNNNFVTIDLGLKWVQNHRYTVKNKQTGTLRTKSITLKDSNGNPEIKRKFEYNYFKYPQYSGGVLRSRPINTVFKTYEPGGDPTPGAFDCPVYNGTCSYITLSSSPAYNLNNSFGKSVYYENVTEVYEDLRHSNQSYKKELEFSSLPEDYNEQNSNFPLPYWTHYEYAAGKSLRERWYNTMGEKVKFIENFYHFDNHFNFQSADHQGAVLSFGVNLALTGLGIINTTPCFYELNATGSYYYITSAWVKHLSTTEENYKNGTLLMTNTTNYNYSPTYSHLNPVSVTTTNSLGQEVKTEYEYNHPYKKDEPTTIRTYENGAAISVQQTTFQAAGLPQYVFAKRGASTLDNVPPSEDLKVTYDRYDDNDNLEQYTLENGTPVSIIWGYNKQYPIAKIEGIVYTSIPAGHITDLVNASNADVNASAENTLRTKLQELRQDNVLGGLMITTYTYDPLIGVTSITTPSGQTEYYIYDTAGRLQKVVDHEQKEVRKIDYHYQD